MLRIDRRDLVKGPVETRATVATDDPLLDGLDVSLAEPLEVSGRLQETGDGEYFWRGRLRGVATGECRRCLEPVALAVDVEVDVLFSDDADDAEDPGVYLLPSAATHVDLGEAVREELALAVPPYVLCREECRGLCPRCGSDLNQGACRCDAAAPDRG